MLVVELLPCSAREAAIEMLAVRLVFDRACVRSVAGGCRRAVCADRAACHVECSERRSRCDADATIRQIQAAAVEETVADGIELHGKRGRISEGIASRDAAGRGREDVLGV